MEVWRKQRGGGRGGDVKNEKHERPNQKNMIPPSLLVHHVGALHSARVLAWMSSSDGPLHSCAPG